MLVDLKLVVLNAWCIKFRDCIPNQGETKMRNVTPESPAFKAGLDRDDILLAIDDKRAHKNNLDLLLKRYSNGDTIGISVFRRSELRHFDVKLAEARPDKYEIKEIEEPSKLQKKIKKNWLNGEEDKQSN